MAIDFFISSSSGGSTRPLCMVCNCLSSEQAVTFVVVMAGGLMVVAVGVCERLVIRKDARNYQEIWLLLAV